MNSFDMMIERYSKELIEAGKKSIISAVEDNDYTEAINNVIAEASETEFNNETADLQNDTEAVDLSTGSGKLKIQTFSADGVYPVVASDVKVYKKGEKEPFFEGYTDASGIIENIILPAPVGVDTDLPSETEPYYEYDIEITHPKFITKKYLNVPIFDNIVSIQAVRLVPVEKGADEEKEIIESENENLMKRDDT